MSTKLCNLIAHVTEKKKPKSITEKLKLSAQELLI